MKRSLSLLLSAVLALSIAPLALAPASAAPTTGSAISAPHGALVVAAAKKKKKKKKKVVIPAVACTAPCVEGTLPIATVGTYFLNDNREVLLVDTKSISVLNLDTRAISRATKFKWKNAPIHTASLTADESYLYVYSSGHGIYRVDLSTMEVVNVSPNGANAFNADNTYDIVGASGGNGYFAGIRVTNSGNSFICHFSSTGAQIGACTDELYSYSLGIAALLLTPDESHIIFIRGDNPSSTAGIRSYLTSNLSLASSFSGPLPNVDQVWAATMNPNGTIVMSGETTQGVNSGRDYMISMNSSNLTVGTTTTLPVDWQPYRQLVSTASNEAYILASKWTETTTQNNLITVDVAAGSVSQQVPFAAVVNNSVAGHIAVDSADRYAITSGNDVRSEVVALHTNSDRIAVTTTRMCGFATGYQIGWDYLNLNLQAGLAKYVVAYNNAAGTAPLYSAAVTIGAFHEYTAWEAQSSWKVRIYTTVNKAGTIGVDTTPFTITSPPHGLLVGGIVHQPRC